MGNALKNKVIHGLKWSMLEKLIMQLFSWASTFYVIRLLTPQDYGVVALATIVFSFINLLAVNGFTSALVKAQEKVEKTSDQVFTISLIINIGFSLIVALFAGDIATFYKSEELENVLYVMAVIMPLNSFTIVPEAYLIIDMNFKKKAFGESLSSISSTVVALVMAYLGFAFWALVMSRVVGLVVKVFAFNGLARCKYFITKSFSGAGKIAKYTANLQINSTLWFIYNKLDGLIIGKYFSVSDLGIYNVAVEIASLPMTKVSGILNQVGFSAFSSLKEEKSATDYYLRKSLLLMGLFIFPVFFGISLVADELVAIVLGAKWQTSAAIISVFCLVFPFRMLNSLIQSYVNAMNRPGFNVANTAIIATVLIVSILIGVQFGLFETAIAWLLGFVLAFSVMLYRLKKAFALGRRVIFAWGGPFILSVLMYVVVFSIDWWLLSGPGMSAWLPLTVKIVIGGITIVISYALFYRSEILSVVRRS